MKFRKLTIRNIGSIVSKTIDFTASPLDSASLFLISGPTGSGKSIILDAVCLALYGKAVRLEKVSNRENYMDPQFNCTADGSISLSDARQLVRRGTTSACAELVFDGNDGKEYTASWIATRGKKENINTRLTASRHVKASDGSVDCNKEAECNECIASPGVVGLKFDEFCRTTLLAQGEFTKFLDSDTKEKANILEKVTGTEKFSKIGEKINERFKAVQESAKGLLDDINDEQKQPMKDEERKALADEDGALDSRRKALAADRALAVDKKGILDRQKANADNDAKADRSLETAASQKATEGYRSAVKTSADWKAAHDVLESVKARDEAKTAMQRVLDRKPGFMAAFDSLVGGLVWLQESLAQFETLDNDIKTLEGIIEAARREHAKLSPEELAKEGARLGAEKNTLDLVLKQAQIWLSGKKSIIDDGTVGTFSPEQKAAYDDAFTKAGALWVATESVDAAKKKYDEVFAGFQNHAAAVRATLKEGDTCPVCGNIVKTVLTDETIEKILSPYMEDIRTANEAAAKAREACDDVIVSISAKSREKGQEISAWQARNAEVTRSANQIAALVTQLSALQQRTSAKTSVTETIGRITPVMSKVQATLGADAPATIIKSENRNLEADWNALSVKVSTSNDEYDKARTNWEKAKAEVEACSAANPELSEDYLARLAVLKMTDISELDRKVKIVDDMETKAKALKEACRAESEDILKVIAEKGYVFAEGETSEVMGQSIDSIDTAISGIDTRKGEIKKALEVDDLKIKGMRKTREEYEKIRPTLKSYETLNSLFGQGGGTLFKKIAQSHLLGVLLDNANFYLNQFTDRYELMRQEGSLVVLMKDKQQDEAPRPANTLSGGEGFMASLALALGLSSFNSSDFSSDTIFIDEGFGTLSPKCLEGVYDTLASLKKVVGKKVGIISHVEYLKDNIHPQILVEPVGGGLSVIKDPQ